MFENPITFGVLIALLVTFAFYMFNKKTNKNKENEQLNNQKYCILFLCSLILSIIIKLNMEKTDLKDISMDVGSCESTNIENIPPF